MNKKEMRIIMECLRYNAVLASNNIQQLQAVKSFYDIQSERIREMYGSPREDIKEEPNCETCVHEGESPMPEVCGT